MRSGKHGNLQFAPFYRHTTNVMRVDINTEAVVADVTTISFKNLATSSFAPMLNGTLRLGNQRARRLQRLPHGHRRWLDVGGRLGRGEDAWMACTEHHGDADFAHDAGYHAPARR